jgi:uncharacterized protein (TIGR02246 family)
VFALSLLLVAATSSWAEEPVAQPIAAPAVQTADQPAAPPAAQPAAQAQPADDTDAIRERVKAYVDAYNKHDAAALAELWADDAVYLNRETGEPIEGRPAIASMFDDMFKEGEADQLAVTVDSIRKITPDVAIEDGTAILVSAEGEPMPSTYTAVHVKKDGQWYLNSVRDTDLPSSPAEAADPGELDQLEWMVGEWVDQDAEGTVRTRCEWAKNHKFLTSHFDVSTGDSLELEGTQVIGWDPVSGTIRSWMFDSEGGFGEGVWSRNGNQWTVQSKSTQADGSQATSTNIYTILDDNTFTWKSVDRQVDGEPQPDVDEVPVYRQ